MIFITKLTFYFSKHMKKNKQIPKTIHQSKPIKSNLPASIY